MERAPVYGGRTRCRAVLPGVREEKAPGAGGWEGQQRRCSDHETRTVTSSPRELNPPHPDDVGTPVVTAFAKVRRLRPGRVRHLSQGREIVRGEKRL